MICFDDPKYWRDLAKAELSFAADKRTARHGTVEAIRIHEQNAAEYEARAVSLESAAKA